MKGIIIAAGYGTRFLPATKTIPKEMLPIIDKPAIEFIVEEFVDSGITELILVTSRRKKVLDDYFDREFELEVELEKANKIDLLNKIKLKNIKISYIRQHEMKGIGNALLLCKHLIKDENTVVAYPDDVTLSNPPLSKVMLELSIKHNKSVLFSAECPSDKDISRFGVIKYYEEKVSENVFLLEKFVEKPAKDQAPSNLISFGRFVYTPEFFDYLEKDYKNFSGKEFFHVGALNKLANEKKVLVYKYEGIRFDLGEPADYLKSVIQYALLRDDLKDEMSKYLKSLNF